MNKYLIDYRHKYVAYFEVEANSEAEAIESIEMGDHDAKDEVCYSTELVQVVLKHPVRKPLWEEKES